MMWRAIVILLKPPMGSTASVNQTFLIRALTRDLVSKNEDQVGESWRSYGLEVLGEGDSAGAVPALGEVAAVSFANTATRAMFKAPTKHTAPAMAARIASQRRGLRQPIRVGRSSLKVLLIYAKNALTSPHTEPTPNTNIASAKRFTSSAGRLA